MTYPDVGKRDLITSSFRDAIIIAKAAASALAYRANDPGVKHAIDIVFGTGPNAARELAVAKGKGGDHGRAFGMLTCSVEHLNGVAQFSQYATPAVLASDMDVVCSADPFEDMGKESLNCVANS